MIRTQELVPDYYIEKSRDFQVLCRLLDFLLNSTKYNTDSMLNLTDTERAKNTILPLIGDKFGIYDKDAYSTREMLDALPCALQHKGSMHAVLTLIHAFLDSMDIFEYATVYNAKNKKSADEISEILRRDVSPYTIVIVLSTYPDLTKLRILDTYLRMVIPTGMFIDYAFGYSLKIIDKYKYKDFVILYYTRADYTDEMGDNHQLVSIVKNNKDKLVHGSDLSNLPDYLTEDEKQFVRKVSKENTELVHTAGIASVESSSHSSGNDGVARTDEALTDINYTG